MPDAPLIEYPANKTLEFALIARMAMKIGASFNIELFTVKHVLAILFVAMLILYHGFLYLLSFIFWKSCLLFCVMHLKLLPFPRFDKQWFFGTLY